MRSWGTTVEESRKKIGREKLYREYSNSCKKNFFYKGKEKIEGNCWREVGVRVVC